MRSFKEALIDAILEEYAEHQSVQHEAVQSKYRGESNTDSASTELKHTSLWLDRKEKQIYLHPIPGATQYVFLNQASKDTCLQMLIRSGYTLHD